MMLLLGLLLVAPAQAGTEACNRDGDSKAAIASELLQYYNQEQADFKAQDPDKAKADADRLAAVKRIVEKGWACSASDKFHAAWILRLSDDAKLLEQAYGLSKEALAERIPRANWLTAYLYDRWHVALGRVQRYGAITAMHKGKVCLYEVDEAATDEERATYGMPPIAQVYQRVLEENGYGAPFDAREINRRNLFCPPVEPPKR